MSATLDPAKLKEMHRLLAERAAKKRELDTLDKAIERCAGLPGDEGRPKRATLSAQQFRAACNMGS